MSKKTIYMTFDKFKNPQSEIKILTTDDNIENVV
jgi:hypothetical protein